jgi:hypothetical protein
VSFSLSHFVLPSRSAQMVLLSLIDYSSSNNVSILSQIGNSAKDELVLYETSEGSGIFQSLSLMCCDVDGCPGISAAAGFTVAFYYNGQVLRDSLKCLSNWTFVNTTDCLNSLVPSPYFSRSTQSLRVYNFFADAPFSLSLQHQPRTHSLRFISVSIMCNNSAAEVARVRQALPPALLADKFASDFNIVSHIRVATSFEAALASVKGMLEWRQSNAIASIRATHVKAAVAAGGVMPSNARDNSGRPIIYLSAKSICRDGAGMAGNIHAIVYCI